MKLAVPALLLAAGLAFPASAQSSRTDAIEALPDPPAIAPAQVPYVHPLYRPVDTAAAPTVARPPFAELESMTLLAVTVRVDATGRVVEASAVEPPLKCLAAPIPALIPKWKYAPATKGGSPVATWATLGLELLVDLEKGAWSSLSLTAVGAEEPLVAPVKESQGDGWMARYPKEIGPKDPGAVSVEDVDEAPVPSKTSWDFDGSRQRSHVQALLEVSAAGGVTRFVPIGAENEPLVTTWVRKSLPGWKLTPATSAGKAVSSWLVLDGSIEYTVSSAKLKNRRSIKKNLRGTPAG